MDKKFHFVYLTTNLINNKKYLGKHSTNNLDDGYLGSGVYLIRSIKLYGKENFKRDILSFHNSSKEAYEEEKSLAKLLEVKNSELFYNLTDCGEGNNYWQGKKRSVEDIEKFKISHIGQRAWNKNLPKELNPVTGRKYSEDRINKIRLANTGRKHSEETLIKLRESHLGQKAWNKGRTDLPKHSQETKSKRSSSLKGKGCKVVLQFDLDMNFIREWPGVLVISEGGFNSGAVSECCKGRIDSYKNYIWKFKNYREDVY